MKKVIIAGSRNFEDYSVAREFIQSTIDSVTESKSVIIISGGCRGADKLGERYAIENGLDLEVFKADWARYKKAAGPIRNREMVLASDVVICFWDNKSKGTRSLIELANKNAKPVYVKIIK